MSRWVKWWFGGSVVIVLLCSLLLISKWDTWFGGSGEKGAVPSGVEERVNEVRDEYFAKGKTYNGMYIKDFVTLQTVYYEGKDLKSVVYYGYVNLADSEEELNSEEEVAEESETVDDHSHAHDDTGSLVGHLSQEHVVVTMVLDSENNVKSVDIK